MAVFRVEKNSGYTVMSNHHLRNQELSLKAKGLLSQMLSLPDNWDYTLKGLSLINREKIDAPEQPETPAVKYYPINEGAARRANDANSYRDYAAGSATAEYRQMVDEAAELAQRQKERVDPMYHEKIDALLDTYARKLAATLNDHYAIEARVPSILIAGGSNFPVAKKHKQNAARDRNMQEWQDVQGMLAAVSLFSLLLR